MAARKAYIVGVGMTAFTKPADKDYPILGLEGAVKALIDAGLTYDDVDYAAAGYVYGDSTCGQRVLYQLGMTGIPSSTSTTTAPPVPAPSTSLPTLSSLVRPSAPLPSALRRWLPVRSAPPSPTGPLLWRAPCRSSLRSRATRSTRPRTLVPLPLVSLVLPVSSTAKSTVLPGTTLPRSRPRTTVTRRRTPTPSSAPPRARSRCSRHERSPVKSPPPMCSPTSDGGAAVIVASEDFVKKHKLEDRAIELAGMGVATDSIRLYEDRSRIELAGADMSRRAAQIAYKQAGIQPKDVQVLELHDCFAPNELVTYPALGLCAEGEAHKLVEQKLNTYNDSGKGWVVNLPAVSSPRATRSALPVSA